MSDREDYPHIEFVEVSSRSAQPVLSAAELACVARIRQRAQRAQRQTTIEETHRRGSTLLKMSSAALLLSTLGF